jgi:hypothetical protein
MEKGLPNVTSEHAAEGTRLHAEVAAAIELWCGKEVANPPLCTDVIAQCLAFFEKVIKGEEFATINEVREAIAAGTVKVFTELAMEWSAFGKTHTSGTADVIIVTPSRLLGIDWKFGRRKVTDAANNWQGAAYSLLAMMFFGRESAEFHFYNPVINQETSATFADKDQIAKSIMQVIRKSESGELVPGEKQCRYCKAALHGTCPVVLKKLETFATLPEVQAPRVCWTEKPDAELIQLYEAAKVYAKYAEKAGAELMRRITQKGSPVADYDVKYTSGGRKITDMVEAFGLLGDGITQEEFLRCCTVSVAQLESKFCEKLKSSGQVKTLKEGKAIFAEILDSVLEDNPLKASLVCTK